MTATRHRGPVARRRDAALFGLAKPIMRGIQRTREQQFEALGGTPGAVVFLGDSISEQGLWSDWFPGVPTSNRGISGQTTAQILRRLDSAVDRPRAVLLLAGTNDLTDGSRPADVASRLERIVDALLRRAPGAPVLVQSVMPRKAAFAGEVQDVNRRLRAVCAARPGTTWVDLWPVLATPEHALRPELTNDSLHLNGAGYAAWTAVIRPLIDAPALE